MVRPAAFPQRVAAEPGAGFRVVVALAPVVEAGFFVVVFGLPISIN